MPGFRDECGVFGVWDDPQSGRLTYLGLYALQHRGQESAGIVSLQGKTHCVYKGLGLVSEVFNEDVLKQLLGQAAIGHVRYSTTGRNEIKNAQPLTLADGEPSENLWAIAHNGNFTNSADLREELTRLGARFAGTNDTEILLHLLSRARQTPAGQTDLVWALKQSLSRIEGAYSLLLLGPDCLIAARDPHGFRPLVLGEKPGELGKTSFVLSSESCAFDLIGAKMLREIEPGEILIIDATGAHSTFLEKKSAKSQCIFEHVYFARPDSIVFRESVYEARKKMGEILALEQPAVADVVVPVPDSGVPAALGFSKQSGIPFELGIIRNHYVGRTFIQPHQSIRSFGVKVKLNAQSAVLGGKRVVIVDDSVVRGTTSKKIVALVRQAGASEVHLRISAPPTTGPCYYGVDTPEASQLIAAQKSLAEICAFVEADSLGYLSEGGLMRAVGGGGYCAACFNGKYPTQVGRLN